ncbi:MAG: NAD(P)/FAD-dependent oxidoreductase [Anaerolineae bacterium]|jgi:protoporphyrinogen oxidase|nr:NAD(P)/FAD-dependent oxidoreductase [Anaerolineae bacterium]
MNIAIIGAGPGGLSAAFDLRNAGHDVTIFEAADSVGGLMQGIRQPNWEWSVEKYYHHWFTSDSAMMKLIKECGLADKVQIRTPKTVIYYKDAFYPLDSPLAALKFPGFNLIDIARFGFVTIYLRYLANWKKLEQYRADEWLRKAYGKRVYAISFEPMVEGKFGPYAKEVTLAWFWARIKARSTQLATYNGGFQAFSEDLGKVLADRGVKFEMSAAVEKIQKADDGTFNLTVNGEERPFDQVVATVPPHVFAKMVPQLSEADLGQLRSLKHMGAVVMILSMKHTLSEEGYYWFNMPKSAGFPFLAAVEHTNFIPSEHFGGEHILYLGDYLPSGHEYFDLSKEELLDRFLPSLKRINPNFSEDWIINSWVHKAGYAQPVPEVNHSQKIPPIRTSLEGLYFVSMSHIYPWDRGTNFAVEWGRDTAKMVLEDNR